MKGSFSRRAGRVGLLLTLACGADATAPVAGPDPVVSAAWVTGRALTALGADGRFTLDTPASSRVSRAHADSFALATVDFLREVFGDLSSEDVLSGRGGPVHLAQLVPCLRRIYASTALDLSSLPGGAAAARFSASSWLVSMCSASGAAELVVSVTDAPSQIVVANNRFVGLWGNRGDFSFFPVPISTAQHGLYLSPEAAVELVARASGVRVSDVPQANISYIPDGARAVANAPQCVTWKVSTEVAKSVITSTGRTVTTAEYFVKRVEPCGVGAVAAFVAAPVQPTALWKHIRAPSDTSISPDSALIPTRGPVFFERVTTWRVP